MRRGIPRTGVNVEDAGGGCRLSSPLESENRLLNVGRGTPSSSSLESANRLVDLDFFFSFPGTALDLDDLPNPEKRLGDLVRSLGSALNDVLPEPVESRIDVRMVPWPKPP